MQPTTKTLTIGILYERSDIGTEFIRSMNKTFGEGVEAVDQNRYLYKQFSKVFDQGQVTINALLNTGRSYYISSLYPKTNNDPDLLFIFNSCVGVNPMLCKGDLVILHDSNEALKKEFASNQKDILASLPEIKLNDQAIDLDEVTAQIVSLLHQGPRKGKEIQEQLHLSGEQMRLVMEKILTPNEEKLWNVNPETYQWSLTSLGEEKHQKQACNRESSKLHKPCVSIGISDSTPDLIKSTTELKVDVIEQLSKVIFECNRSTVEKIKTMQVSVVKCSVNDDIEDGSPYAASMADAMAVFLLKMVEVQMRS